MGNSNRRDVKSIGFKKTTMKALHHYIRYSLVRSKDLPRNYGLSTVVEQFVCSELKRKGFNPLTLKLYGGK